MRRALTSLGELVDRTWPWLPVGLLAAAALVFLGSYVAGPGASDAEQVNDTVERFAIAAANSDGEEACSLSTPVAQRRFVGSLEGLTCAQAVRNFGVGVAGRELRDAPRDEPVVDGDRARLDKPTIGVRFVLVRDGGDWRIDGVQRFAARPRR